MKKIIVRGALVIACLLIFVAVASFFFLGSIVKKGVETVGPPLAKVEMRLGGATVSPLSGRCELSKLFIGNPEGFKTPSAIEVGEVKVGVKVSSLFSETIQVEEINIQGPEITFEGGITGNNLSKILDNINSAVGGAEGGGEKKEPAKEPSASEGGKRLYVKDVIISGGKIRLSIKGTGGAALPVPLPPIHLQDIGTPEKGVTSAELAQAIMKSITSGTLKAVSGAVVDLGKGVTEIGTNAAEGVGKAVKGIKGLFKK